MEDVISQANALETLARCMVSGLGQRRSGIHAPDRSLDEHHQVNVSTVFIQDTSEAGARSDQTDATSSDEHEDRNVGVCPASSHSCLVAPTLNDTINVSVTVTALPLTLAWRT